MTKLMAAAMEARERAHAPFSNFKVGAALEAADGRIFTGCNIENASYGLTMCAERVAMFKGISEGAREFRAIAIATGADTLTPPCGACRQILWEFGGDLLVEMGNVGGESEIVRLSELFPRAFDAKSLS